MNFKKLESGRSMVEMLGVLAIIGVLSVGGIAGYSLSMRRHRANAIVDVANKYSLVIYNACQQQILNGEINSISSCDTSDKNKKVPPLDEADIGTLPAGVHYVHKISFGQGYPGNVDLIGFSVEFDDDKLCQAVGAVTGSGCRGNTVHFETKHD